MAQRADVGRTGTVRVSFVCQKCHHPLQLDDSFRSLNDRMQAELTVPLRSASLGSETSENQLSSIENQPISITRRIIPPAFCSITHEMGSDFTIVGEAMSADIHTFGVVARLYDVLSGQSEVDHPLCEECTDNLLDQLDVQLKSTEEEFKDYKDYLEKLNAEQESSEEKQLDEELQKLKDEEKSVLQQLATLESERKEVKRQIEVEKQKSKQLNEAEAKEYHEYKRQLLEYEDAQRSVENQLKYSKSQLDKLKKTNVFNATFHIWHSGHFGTINGFRLGRLPSVPVEWNEINAAWGQTALLLHSLARKMSLQFKRYRIVPFGNSSYLECLDGKSKELPLYGSGGIRFLWDNKFDQAMVAFLDCLQQFKEEIEKGDTGFCLPYKMDKGHIEDSGTSYSVKMQFNSEEQWTKALKFMLTNLKWGVAWVSSQFAS